MTNRHRIALTWLAFGATVSLFPLILLSQPFAGFASRFIACAVAGAIVCSVALVVADGIRHVKTLHRAELLSRGHCPNCGYDTRGNKGRCSECGELIPPRAVELAEPRETPTVTRLLQAADEFARAESKEYVGSEHVLLALMDEDDSLATIALANLGVDEVTFRKEVERLRDEMRFAPPAPTE